MSTLGLGAFKRCDMRLILVAAVIWRLGAEESAACKLTTVAGSVTEDAGDGGPANQAQLSNISAVAFDAAGVLHIGTGRKIRVMAADGAISTFAGTGRHSYDGDDGPATAASFRSIAGLRIDSKGNVYVSDRRSHVVRRIDPSGNIVTVAGTGRAGFNGHVGIGSTMQLNGPTHLAIDADDNVYVVDSFNNVVRRLTPDGMLETVAGSGESGPAPGPEDGARATETRLLPTGIAIDSKGSLLILNTPSTVLRVDAGRLFTVIGSTASYPEGLFPQISLSLTGLAVSPSGDLYLEQSQQRATGTTAWLRYIGNRAVASVPGSAFQLVGFTPGGQLLGSQGGEVLFRLEEGKMIAVSGASSAGFMGDGGPGTAARLSNPTALAAAPDGSLYFVDAGNWRVRRLTPDGAISTHYASEDRFDVPIFVTIDDAGNLYVGNSGLVKIRKIDIAGNVSSILGGSRPASTSGPLPAAEASVQPLQSLHSDAAGNLFLNTIGLAGYWLIEASSGLIYPQRVGSLYSILGRHRDNGILALYRPLGLFRLDASLPPEAIKAPPGQLIGGTFATDPVSGDIFNVLGGSLRKIDREGFMHLVSSFGDDDNLFAASSPPFAPTNIAFDRKGDMYLADTQNRVRRLTSPGKCPSTPIEP